MFSYLDCYSNIYNINIKKSLPFNFNLKFIHNFIIFYKNNFRLGTRCQKNRSQINYSTKKIYKQKGTGKSRAGSLSSNIRRKGSRAFPSFFFENFIQKFNKKNFKIIIFIIFSKIIKERKFYFVDDVFFVNINTKKFLKRFFFLLSFKTLFLSFKINLNFFLSQRNYYKFEVINLKNLNPIILIKYNFVLFSISSIIYFY